MTLIPPSARETLQILGIYLASRVLTTGLLLAAFLLGPALRIPFGSPHSSRHFLTFLAMWDGTYYRHIALQGYPSTMPTDAAGHVLQNTWAFLPLYPAVVRVVMGALGLSLIATHFDAVAVAVSLLAGAASALLLHRLLRRTTTPRAALWGTVLFCAGPLSFVLQVAYAESLFLALLFGALLALQSDRLLVFTLLAVAACATRPGGVVLVVALLAHLFVRWRHGERPRIAASAVSGGIIVVAGFAWPLVAAVVTGDLDGYTATELSWWTGYIGRPALVPFSPWFLMATRYLGLIGIIVVLAAWGFSVLVLTRRSVRALGSEIQGFSAGQLIYLAAVFLPQQSLPRLLLPLAPLYGASPLSRTPTRRSLLLGASIVSQVPAILLLWAIGYP